MVFRRKEATRVFFFQSKRRKPCSKQDYQCTFPLVPSPACSALLCSFTTPSLLSVCLSLRQKHSSAECGGMGAQTQSLSPPRSLSLPLLMLNCAAQGEKKLLSVPEKGCVNSCRVSKEFGKKVSICILLHSAKWSRDCCFGVFFCFFFTCTVWVQHWAGLGW